MDNIPAEVMRRHIREYPWGVMISTVVEFNDKEFYDVEFIKKLCSDDVFGCIKSRAQTFKRLKEKYAT